MHMPERWGTVQFSDAAAGAAATRFVEDRNERVKWALRRLYYRQQAYRQTHGRYAADLTQINVRDIHVEGLAFAPSIQVTESSYELQAPGFEGVIVHLRHDGRTWVRARGNEDKEKGKRVKGQGKGKRQEAEQRQNGELPGHPGRVFRLRATPDGWS